MLEQYASRLQDGSYRRQMTYALLSRQSATEGSRLRNALGRADFSFASFDILTEWMDELLQSWSTLKN